MASRRTRINPQASNSLNQREQIMTAQIIDGKTIAQQVRAERKERAKALKAGAITPGLAVIIVGEVPASKVYVANKVKACAELGLHSEHIALPADTSEATLLAKIAELN